MFHYIISGGIVMIPIGLVSIAALAILIEKFSQLSKFKKPPAGFLTSVSNYIRKQEWESALLTCRKSQHPLAQILETGFLEFTKNTIDLRAVEEAMRRKGDETIYQLETSLKWLASLITVLPLLGFLGTIIGLISSFSKWQTLGANVTIAHLSGGMYEAMITTAAGLILAIPYHLAYVYLAGRVERIELTLSAQATEFLSRIRQANLQYDTGVYTDPEISSEVVKNK
ncbi:MAG: MotA/TolQ/ExbB proton channel family protein [Candidatus Omnitrophica bacterium]|nr:MotA/TolQ/ExbB proton channel family protein [Candidatus Omnitrophota bacterium]